LPAGTGASPNPEEQTLPPKTVLLEEKKNHSHKKEGTASKSCGKGGSEKRGKIARGEKTLICESFWPSGRDASRYRSCREKRIKKEGSFRSPSHSLRRSRAVSKKRPVSYLFEAEPNFRKDLQKKHRDFP